MKEEKYQYFETIFLPKILKYVSENKIVITCNEQNNKLNSINLLSISRRSNVTLPDYPNIIYR